MSRKTLQKSVMRVNRLNLSAQDAVGGIEQVKTNAFTAPCRIRQLKANEMYVGGKDDVVATHRIYCERLDIRSSDEIIVSKQVYDINGINSIGGKLEVDVIIRD